MKRRIGNVGKNVFHLGSILVVLGLIPMTYVLVTGLGTESVISCAIPPLYVGVPLCLLGALAWMLGRRWQGE